MQIFSLYIYVPEVKYTFSAWGKNSTKIKKEENWQVKNVFPAALKVRPWPNFVNLFVLLIKVLK
jgi:hypothetical protein